MGEEDEEEEEVPPPDEEEEEEEDEEDLIDPADAIKENCAISGCMPLRDRLEECNTRAESKSKTSETCFEEILDFYHCVDHCAAKEIFKVTSPCFFITLYLPFVQVYCC